MLGYQTFNNDAFTDYPLSLDMKFKTLPLRHYKKNVLKSKRGAVRSIFLRLTGYDSNNHGLAARRAVRTSNGLSISDTLSAFEMTGGFKMFVSTPFHLSAIDLDLINVNLRLEAKRKLTLVLRSKAVTANKLQVGSIVALFLKRDNGKMDKWPTL